MEINLTETEIYIIKIWADNNIHGGHWGDGDFMVPEENIILEKINNIINGELNLTEKEAQIILVWSESARGIYTMEEESAIKKIKSVIKENIGHGNERNNRAN